MPLNFSFVSQFALFLNSAAAKQIRGVKFLQTGRISRVHGHADQTCHKVRMKGSEKEKKRGRGGRGERSHPLLQLGLYLKWTANYAGGVRVLASLCGAGGERPPVKPQLSDTAKGGSQWGNDPVYEHLREGDRERDRERKRVCWHMASPPIPMATEFFLPSLSPANECRPISKGKRGQHAHNWPAYKKHSLKTLH